LATHVFNIGALVYLENRKANLAQAHDQPAQDARPAQPSSRPRTCLRPRRCLLGLPPRAGPARAPSFSPGRVAQLPTGRPSMRQPSPARRPSRAPDPGRLHLPPTAADSMTLPVIPFLQPLPLSSVLRPKAEHRHMGRIPGPSATPHCPSRATNPAHP